MYAIKKLLVTTDFSDYSAAALEYALSFADVHRADVHLLHAIEGHPNTEEEANAHEKMQKFIFEKVDEYTSVHQVILVGSPPDEIIRYAREHVIDLIVIATHGRTGLAHVVMGSIAEKVIRHSTVPVLAVKPAAVLEQLVTDKDIVHDLHIDNL